MGPGPVGIVLIITVYTLTRDLKITLIVALVHFIAHMIKLK